MLPASNTPKYPYDNKTVNICHVQNFATNGSVGSHMLPDLSPFGSGVGSIWTRKKPAAGCKGFRSQPSLAAGWHHLGDKYIRSDTRDCRHKSGMRIREGGVHFEVGGEFRFSLIWHPPEGVALALPIGDCSGSCRSPHNDRALTGEQALSNRVRFASVSF